MRDKNFLFFLCIFLLFVVVVLFLHFSKDEYHTEVIYQNGSITEDNTTSQTNKSSKGSKTSKTSSKTTLQNKTSEEEDGFSEESTLYEEVSIESDDNVWETEEGQTTSETDITGMQSEPGFTSVKEYADLLSAKYYLDLFVYLDKNEDFDNWDCYVDSEKAYSSLQELEGLLAKLDLSDLKKISQSGYPLKIILVRENSATYHPVDQTGIFSGQGIIFQDGGDIQTMRSEFSKAAAAFYYYVMEATGSLEAFSHEFTQWNPTDFNYGQYKPQYVGGDPTATYFLEIAGLKSLREDMASLYSAYYCNQLPEKYLSDTCPVYRKITALLEGWSRYL